MIKKLLYNYRGGLDELIKDLQTVPKWAESFVNPKNQRLEFEGKEELLRAFQGLPYDERIDVDEFFKLFDPDMTWYEACRV